MPQSERRAHRKTKGNVEKHRGGSEPFVQDSSSFLVLDCNVGRKRGGYQLPPEYCGVTAVREGDGGEIK